MMLNLLFLGNIGIVITFILHILLYFLYFICLIDFLYLLSLSFIRFYLPIFLFLWCLLLPLDLKLGDPWFLMNDDSLSITDNVLQR